MCKFPVVFFSWNVRIGEIIPGVLPDLVRSYDARRRFRFRLLCLAFDNAVETHDVRDQKMKDDGATATQEIPQFSLDAFAMLHHTPSNTMAEILGRYGRLMEVGWSICEETMCRSHSEAEEDDVWGLRWLDHFW